MRKKEQAKSLGKFSYLQGWGTYPNQTLVCVGLTRKEIVAKVRAISKISESPCTEILEILEDLDDEKDWDEQLQSRGLFAFYEATGRSLLWLREWDGSWSGMDVLNHEIAHAVFATAKYRAMAEEDEARAYMHEYMFRAIRETLNKKLKSK